MPLAQPEKTSGRTWHGFMLRYLSEIALLNLVWEFSQLPLYTLWTDSSPGQIIFSVLHCTGGDIFIGSLALLAAVLILGNSQWPGERYLKVATGAVAAGIVYTGYSEWTNVYVRKSWAYSGLMPLLPGLGIGLVPLLQWLVIPSCVFARLRSD